LRRGVGRLYAAWLCVGVLVGGTLGNGVSTYIWSAGVPDFISMSDGWMWNVEIVFGLLGTAVSIVEAPSSPSCARASCDLAATRRPDTRLRASYAT
jgi:hypothetical protein